MAAWIALLLLVVAGLALLLRADAGPIAGFDPSEFAIAGRGRGAADLPRCRPSPAATAGAPARPAATCWRWLVVALALVAAYSYREELLALGHRVVGELLPPGAPLRARRRRKASSR